MRARRARVAILLGRKRQVVARFRRRGIEGCGSLEGRAGVGRDGAAVRRHQRLAVVGQAGRILAEEPQGGRVGFGGIIGPPGAGVHRRDDLPAASVVRMLRQMRLHARDRGRHVERLRIGFKPRGQRLARQVGRAESAVSRKRQKGNRRERDRRGRPTAAQGRLADHARADGFGRNRPQETPTRLDPRGLGLLGRQKAALPVPLDLGDLLVIKLLVWTALGDDGAARQRPKHGHDGRAGHQRENDPDGHAKSLA